MESLVEVKLGDGQQLPFADGVFDGGYAQHVTMNIPTARASLRRHTVF